MRSGGDEGIERLAWKQVDRDAGGHGEYGGRLEFFSLALASPALLLDYITYLSYSSHTTPALTSARNYGIAVRSRNGLPTKPTRNHSILSWTRIWNDRGKWCRMYVVDQDERERML